MPQKYLKCKYYEHAPILAFSNEYMVTFKSGEWKNPKPIINEKTNETSPSEGEEWCIVDRKDVILINANEGLVKIVSRTIH